MIIDFRGGGNMTKYEMASILIELAKLLVNVIGMVD